ncbi:hypothetical protein HPB49_002497 [Dermacentor silvarum]|uniref:Uncharacterized protein n=1 Tax=Dermacentor silvarum TaxID=543639 RepID=A0ACB8CPB0_DERSI|nr:hypothetical protein HPB49_002497 [Dermacentor silvarum]
MEGPTTLDPCFATILKYYRENRKIYPPPHGKLGAAEATVLRRLQTNTYINLHTLHLIYPTAYRDICPALEDQLRRIQRAERMARASGAME